MSKQLCTKRGSVLCEYAQGKLIAPDAPLLVLPRLRWTSSILRYEKYDNGRDAPTKLSWFCVAPRCIPILLFHEVYLEWCGNPSNTSFHTYTHTSLVILAYTPVPVSQPRSNGQWPTCACAHCFILESLGDSRATSTPNLLGVLGRQTRRFTLALHKQYSSLRPWCKACF